jgi:NAD(P)-dependent dehydrogenase (short-subunit alcohol dehydrogenase family)
MTGKICIVTGANTGIGKETALGLAKLGATVVMVCRDRERGEAALREIKQKSGNDRVELMICDFSSQSSIRQFASDFNQRHDRLDVLVNNAGVVLREHSMTEDGLESTFAINHLGYFLLTNLLVDVLKKSAPSRIVSVASTGHKFGKLDISAWPTGGEYSAFGAYANSKLANVLFTYELARRLLGSGATATVLHPGVVRTAFGAEDQSVYFKVLIPLMWPFMKTPVQGAATSIYLASSAEVEGVSGE